MTKKETEDSIRSLSSSWYRYTNYDYDYYGAMFKMVWVPQSGLMYSESYRSDGSLQSKGLTDIYSDKSVGTWWYADTAGIIYKEYDYSSDLNILYKKRTDPMQWIFDSLLIAGERNCRSTYGSHYTETHIEISKYITWYTHHEGEGSSGSYPLMPDIRPNSYRIRAVVKYDSVVVNEFWIAFDSNLALIEQPHRNTVPVKRRAFDFDFGQASLVASNRGYSTPILFWSNDFREFYWSSSKCEETLDPYDDEDCSTYIRSATTGRPIPYYFQDSRTCRPSTSFVEYCTDTVHVPPAHKEIGFCGAGFVVPMNWLVTTTDSGYKYTNFMTNGADTIFGISDCAAWAHAYEARTVFDTASTNRFNVQFPSGYIQDRSFDLRIICRDSGKYDIRFTVIEPISAMHCSEITMEFTANGVSAQTRDTMLGIFSTMNFTMCRAEKKPEK